MKVFFAVLVLFASNWHESTAQSVTAVVEKSIGSFKNAVSISRNVAGDIFILDQQDGICYIYDPMLSLQHTFGGKGWGNNEFNNPSDINTSFLLDIVIADTDNNRIQLYNRMLQYQRTLSSESLSSLPSTFQPVAVSFSDQGDLFCLDRDGPRIFKIDQRNTILSEFGTIQSGRGILRQPKDMCVTENGELAVLDGMYVQLFDLFGNYLRSIELTKNGMSHSISSSRSGILVTSDSAIVLVSSDGEIQFDLPMSAIIGDRTLHSLRSALLIQSKLYILTAKTLMICSLHY